MAAVHTAILAGQPVLAFGSLAIVSGISAGAALARGRSKPVFLFWSGLFLAAIALMMWSADGHTEAVRIMLLPSVFFNLLLCLVFGRTLLPGSIPLIAQVIRVEQPDIPAAKLAYARRLTAVWTALFATMTAAALWLALSDDLALWSWFANVVNPLGAVSLFFGEHLLRPARFGGPASPLRTFRLMLRAPIWTPASR